MYSKLFLSFFKIGALTFGGGYTMILLMQRQVVEKYRWVSETEFLEYLTLAQSSPGPMAINIAILIGYKVRSIKGALVAFFASALPSFIIMLVIALFFQSISDNEIVISVFKGMRPAVVALILYPVIIFSKHISYLEYPLLAIMAGLIYFAFSPLWFILAAIFYGAAKAYILNKQQ